MKSVIWVTVHKPKYYRLSYSDCIRLNLMELNYNQRELGGINKITYYSPLFPEDKGISIIKNRPQVNKDGYVCNQDCVLYLQENGEMSNADQKTRNGEWKI